MSRFSAYLRAHAPYFGLGGLLLLMVAGSLLAPQPAVRPSASANRPLDVQGDVIRLRFDYIKNINYDFDPRDTTPAAPPAALQALDGRQVEIAGFALPLYSPTGETEFLLTQSANGCCFGAPPMLQHMILVRAGQMKVNRYGEPVLVRGTLSVGPEWEDGYVTSLLRLQATAVRDLADDRDIE
ncbi:DUF3299 domain-containing protein [Chloracidobacterium sp. MS 40/45]|jgi:hypothetical protein|uniref:DUF3299 domain-containing protein n=1 Tax=Chloracidobacterium aggregatum TaxID=2851959 RepID=UPI001B8CA33B|nr:DUF3299 domain-containing protein [Chloracidobacterium aggregatum]QUW00719.1 DUF3299 domain-containing protein [Chloracidobacterium sp. MS 40/45]